jgi:type IV pilus assembly protein PilQ
VASQAGLPSGLALHVWQASTVLAHYKPAPEARHMRSTAIPDSAECLTSDHAVQPADPGAPGTTASGEPKAQAPVKAIEDVLCSVQVIDGEPAKVLDLLSRQTKVNLVLLTPTTGKMTLNLAGIPFREMLEHICALSGLRYLKVGSTFVLATDVQLKAAYPVEWLAANPQVAPPSGPDTISRIYTASYVDAVKLADSIGKVFDKMNISAVAGPSQATPSVTQVDTSAITGATAVTSGNNTSGSSPTSSNQGVAAKPSKTLILRGDRTLVEEAYKLAQQMDTPRPQVVIEVSVHDISNTALKQLGLSWTVGNIGITENPSGKIAFGSFAFAPQTFDATVSALQETDGDKLLASPSLSVLDGEQAYILIGDRINYPVLVGYSQSGSPIFSSQVERVGIYLQVATSVGTDGSITLCISPQVSSITGYLNVNGASYPQVATREAQTTLRMHSGETMVLGGLLQDEDIVQMSRFPILSDIPILGELFKNRSRSKTSSQVIITLKPTLISADEHR